MFSTSWGLFTIPSNTLQAKKVMGKFVIGGISFQAQGGQPFVDGDAAFGAQLFASPAGAASRAG
jgi:hypothetical protein